MRLSFGCGMLLCLLGCSPSSDEGCPSIPIPSQQAHFKIIVDGSFSEDEQLIIDAAVAEWMIKTGYSLNLQVSREYPITTSPNNWTVCIYPSESIPGVVGNVGWEQAHSILIKTGLSANDFRHVVLHELGHAWRLPHYFGMMPSIMVPKGLEEQQLQCEDIRAFCQIWECQFEGAGK